MNVPLVGNVETWRKSRVLRYFSKVYKGHMKRFENSPSRVKVMPNNGAKPLGLFDGSTISFKTLRFECPDDDLVKDFYVPARVVVRTIKILKERKDELERKKMKNLKRIETLESNAAILEGIISLTGNQELIIKLDKLRNQIDQLENETI